MGIFSFLRRPRLDPAAKAALFAYLKAEIELGAIQTKAADEYNRAGADALASTSKTATEEDAAIGKLVEATSHYLDILNSVATRHISIRVPPGGEEYFLAHELLFRSYVHWCENRLLTYSVADLTKAQLASVVAADKAFMRDKKEADKAKGKLLRTIGVSPQEVVAMVQDASQPDR